MRPQTVTVGPLAAASAGVILTPTSLVTGAVVFNGSAVSGGVATLDVARRLLITSAGNDTSLVFTLVGTNWSGATITERLAGVSATTVQSALDYKTLISAQVSGASGSTVSIGTNNVASTPWVRFDNWAPGIAGVQVTPSTLNNGIFTIEQTMDDPNSPTSPVPPAQMTWVSTSDAAAVAATATVQSNYAYVPIFGRVTLNTGANSLSAMLTATFVQYSAVP